MSILVTSISNWNCDTVVKSLIRNGYIVNYCTIRRRGTPSGSRLIVPPISLFIYIILSLYSKLSKVEIYQSYLWLILVHVFDFESSILLWILKKNTTHVFSWSSSCKYTLKLAKKYSIKNYIYSGNSHIEFQRMVQLQYNSLEINKFLCARMKDEYLLADAILVESEHSRLTFLEQGFRNVLTINNPIDFSMHQVKSIKHTINLAFLGDRNIKGTEFITSLVCSLPDNCVLHWFSAPKNVLTDLSNKPNVIFYSRMQKSEFTKRLAFCDILLLPTYEDGGPRILSEAIGLGLFSLGSIYSKLPEFVKFNAAKIVSHNVNDYISNILNINQLPMSSITNIELLKNTFSEHNLDTLISEIL